MNKFKSFDHLHKKNASPRRFKSDEVEKQELKLNRASCHKFEEPKFYERH